MRYFLLFLFCCLPAHAGNLAERLKHDYFQARAEFRGLAKALQQRNPALQLNQHEISYSGEALTIDSVFIPPKVSSNTLVVLISGQHGVEGPAGSAIQRSLMADCLHPSDDSTGILLIHAMNPYGFKNGRRFNGNNVDLNRNFFDSGSQNHELFPGRKSWNKSYKSLQNLLEHPMNLLSEAIEFVRLGFSTKTVAEALSGQYQSPNGIYYGGDHVERESEIVQLILRSLVPSFKNVLLLNIHTGYGAWGISNLLTTPPREPGSPLWDPFRREKAALYKIFPEGSCNGKCLIYENKDSDLGTIAMEGTLTQWLYNHFEQKRSAGIFLPVVAEIGTFAGFRVLPSIVNETYCNVNPGSCTAEEIGQKRESLRASFNPDFQDWQQSVSDISSGFCRAISTFSSL